MKSIESQFASYLSEVYKDSIPAQQAREVKGAFYAGVASMFNQTVTLSQMSEAEQTEAKKSFAKDMDAFYRDWSAVPSDDAADTSFAAEQAQLKDAISDKPSTPKHEINAAMHDLGNIYKSIIDTPDVDARFVDCLNARISVFFAALRGLVDKEDLKGYLQSLAEETSEISFSTATQEEAEGMREAQGQSLH